MIRPIDIRLNAAHPELPLAEAVTFTGSPSTVLIRGVPPNCGRWAITAVFVAATYPDGSTTTRAAVQSANGVWVATLPATARSGRTENGLRVMADGIDENGAAVTGYILGVADFAVASLGVTPAPEPGETSWQMLYFDAVPGTLRKGDVTKIDGVLKLYNGTAWEAFAGDIPAPSTATPAMDGTGAAGTSAAFARGDHVHPTDTSRVPTSRKVNGKALSSDVTLTGADIAVSGTDATKINAALAGKASKADATLTERGFSAWEVTPATFQGVPIEIRWVDATQYGYPGYSWEPFAGSLMLGGEYAPNEDATTFYCESTISEVGGPISATRTALSGYQLGSQTDKPLASEAEAEALRTGKQDALSAQQLANIAAVPNKANSDGPTITSGMTVEGSIFAERIYTRLNQSQACYGPGAINVPSGGVAILPTLAQGESGTLALTAADPTAGNLAALDANGNPTDAGWTAGDLARYSLVTKTISSGAVTLDDRAINAVAVSSSLASLTVNFPTATSGKARDFGLRLTVASGITTAPELALPQGVVCENADGEAPEIGADGAATILYFTETASGVFLVKGEVVTAIS